MGRCNNLQKYVCYCILATLKIHASGPWGPVDYFYSSQKKELRMSSLQPIGLYAHNILWKMLRDPETVPRGTITLHFMLLQN